ncbi:MAG: LLM class F420-dependent oxidoreductase [Dehalococcoidia bacterium]|nr:LLM class F420-dependent oxidoreductase [Dehalococcoidia bacterium]MYD28334.1 LLM class F420-dependent oxidoreductase [Dehalococcoidia bacterium]
MQIGAIFPQTEIGSDPSVIRDFAQTAEGLGYSHILAYDHVLGALPEREPRLWGPYTHESAFHEPFVLFGYLAAITERVELVTGVIILPQRQTALVAKQAAEVDILSGGRLRLGIGTGWNYVEYDSLNEDFTNRGKRQEEQVEVLRQLWAEPIVDFDGNWHRIDRAGLKPLPGRRIPIWFGGFSDPAFRRAARIGDGFVFGNGSPDARNTVETIRGYLQEEGRDPGSFGFEAMMNYGDGPENWAAEVDRWRETGVDYVSMRTMNAGLESPRDHIEALERYWREVGG